jgi:hypothetical protein
VSKLIIASEALARIRSAVAALENREAPAPELAKESVAADEMPAKVKAFWHREERLLEPWELETAEERQERLQAESRGCWTG